MLVTEKQKAICKKYSAYDSTGRVNCDKCPLRISSYLLTCLAFMHYDRQLREWVVDENAQKEP